MEKTVLAYAQTAKELGCPREQVENFFKAQIFLQPKQLEMASAARRCDLTDGPTMVGVGGARGGGKSQWMFAQISLDDCVRFPGLKVLLLRKSATAMKEQIRDMLQKTCKFLKYNYKEQAGIVEFENGSFIIVKHFKDDKDIDNFLGQEYDVMAIEELTTLGGDKIKNLLTCLRTSKPGWRPRLYAAWNWGGISHQYVKRMFYDAWFENRQVDTFYIKATVADNNYVNPENKKILETMTGWKYKSWYLGDPNFQAGQFFTNWNESWHVYPNTHVTLQPKNPKKWIAGFDYGFAHPTAFILSCLDDMGNVFTVAEYCQEQSVIEEHAQNIFALLKQYNLDVRDLDFIAAGADCFSRKPDGRTIAQEYEDCGIILSRTEIDRVNAWAVMQQRLGDVERNIEPTWFIHKSCKNLIAQIPMAQNHDTRQGDIEKMNYDSDSQTGGDDALDSARNLLVMEISGVATWVRPLTLHNQFKPQLVLQG